MPFPASEAQRLAADPRTDPDTLYRLAFEHPEVHLLLAENPGTYPELLTWLDSLGDPAVAEALARREASRRRTRPSWLTAPVIAILALVVLTAAVMLAALLNPGSTGSGAAWEDPPPAQTASPAPENPAAPVPEGALALTSFTAPSGNIACTLTESGAHCTITAYSFEPPPGCTAGSPVGVVVDEMGARPDCEIPPVIADGATLAYGTTAAQGRFYCTSERTGMTCTDSWTGARFDVARARLGIN